MSELHKNKEIKKQIENLKNICLKYENESNNIKYIEEERIKLENEISNIEEDNKEKKKEIEKLKRNYQNLLNTPNSNNENLRNMKEKELQDLKIISNNINKELKQMKEACDLLKDENYIIKLLGYWYPQAMFKYIQAYDKQK